MYAIRSYYERGIRGFFSFSSPQSQRQHRIRSQHHFRNNADPKENPARFLVDEQLTLKWLHRGAQPTETVKSLLRKAGIWKKFHEEKKEKKAVA